MWCFVTQPNAVTLEVEVDHKATGQHCLEKVCKNLGVIEEDYFGLQYRGAKGENLWLNLRNQIRRQVTRHPPHRFALRVKFWVPPHLILQETTRHLFYLHVRLELSEGHLLSDNGSETAVKLAALIAQAESGNISETSQASLYASCLGLSDPEDPENDDLLDQVAKEHAKLKGMKSVAAEYWVLKEVSDLENYGMDWYRVRNAAGACMQLGVGPQGVTLDDEAGKQCITYNSIQNVRTSGKTFILLHNNSQGETETVELKLDTSQLAYGLYRAITEKHAFYSCETVRSAVTAQFIRDLKGTIASLFNENTALGKKYVFDIRRTCREVYDNARRVLYQSGHPSTGPDATPSRSTRHHHPYLDASEGQDSSPCAHSSCQTLRDHLATLQDAMTCRVCMDREINSAFCPCGHVVCCMQCSVQCDRCPVCRTAVTHTQPVYLPVAVHLRAHREMEDEDQLGSSPSTGSFLDCD